MRDVEVYEPNDSRDLCSQCPQVPAKDAWGEDTRGMVMATSPQCPRCGSNIDHPHELDKHDCIAAIALRIARIEARMRHARLEI